MRMRRGLHRAAGGLQPRGRWALAALALLLVAACEVSECGRPRPVPITEIEVDRAAVCPDVRWVGAPIRWPAREDLRAAGREQLGAEVLLVSRAQLYDVAADGSGLHRIVDASTGSATPVRPVWYGVDRLTSADVSPDGMRVAYTACSYARSGSARGGTNAESSLALAAGNIRLDSRDDLYEVLVWNRVTQATQRLAVGRAPAWSPDGQRLAFLSKYDYATGSVHQRIPPLRLYVMAANGGHVRELARWVVSPPQWAPEGRRLAFLSGRGVRLRGDSPGDALRTVGVDGEEHRQLAVDVVSEPAWSPDGARLAFAKAEGADGAEVALYTIAADGTDARRVTTIEGWRARQYGEPDPTRAWIDTVAWSPAGGQILYTCGLAVCVVDLDGVPVGESPVTFGRPGSPAAWSPDGARIAVGSVGTPGPPDADIVLYTMAPDGGDLRILVRHDADAGLQSVGVRPPDGPVDVGGCAAGAAVPAPAANLGLVRDCETLLAIRDVLAGGAELDWSADRPIAEWDGMELGDAPARVSSLKLVQRGLSGVIPSELAGLTQLRELHLRVNHLGGVIPPELASLAELQELFLDGNYLSGMIPAELGGLTQLSVLGLGSNHLQGIIPPELGELANLQVLELFGNQLTGPIPAELGQLANLRGLSLSANQLTGPIPAELGQLASLEDLSLYPNPLTGCIPSALQGIRHSDLHGLGLPDCE